MSFFDTGAAIGAVRSGLLTLMAIGLFAFFGPPVCFLLPISRRPDVQIKDVHESLIQPPSRPHTHTLHAMVLKDRTMLASTVRCLLERARKCVCICACDRRDLRPWSQPAADSNSKDKRQHASI